MKSAWLPLLAAVLLADLHAAPAFPGAQGFGGDTPGGRGGRIIRVTTLAPSGTGSLAEALRAKGPRIVVFEVGGVIDLEGRSLKVSEPFLTIAGHTAPAPGITLIKGGLGVTTHDVVIRHLRIRPGEAGRAKKSGWEVDGLSTIGASRVIVDHCSFTWATDENLSASGERFKGTTPEEWGENASHHITLSNCLIAEGLSRSTHGKGEHSKGTLIHDNSQFISVIGNLFASNVERNPLAKGGAHAVIAHNWIFNPGKRAIHHALVAQEWEGHPPQTSRLALIGNVLEYGPDTQPRVPFFQNHYDSPLELYLEDNLATDRAGQPAPLTAGVSQPPLTARPGWVGELSSGSAEKVKAEVAKEAGAFPRARDPIDARIVAGALEGRGKIIDSEQEAGGYPTPEPTRKRFNPDEWEIETMTPVK